MSSHHRTHIHDFEEVVRDEKLSVAESCVLNRLLPEVDLDVVNLLITQWANKNLLVERCDDCWRTYVLLTRGSLRWVTSKICNVLPLNPNCGPVYLTEEG